MVTGIQILQQESSRTIHPGQDCNENYSFSSSHIHIKSCYWSISSTKNQLIESTVWSVSDPSNYFTFSIWELLSSGSTHNHGVNTYITYNHFQCYVHRQHLWTIFWHAMHTPERLFNCETLHVSSFMIWVQFSCSIKIQNICFISPGMTY